MLRARVIVASIATWLVSAGCAGSATPAPARPTAASPACATGDELYQVLVNPADDADDFAARTTVSTSGAWSYEADGRPTERGCLGRAEVDQISAALDRATWMQVVTGGTCEPGAAIATHYFVNGQHTYETACGAHLDEPSARAVDEIAAILGAARGR
jgi:hypothetical protein